MLEKPGTACMLYKSLLQELLEIRQKLLLLEDQHREVQETANREHTESATNLIHYIGLRRLDVRALQVRLASAGLSSLGRSESHVLNNLDAVIAILRMALSPDGQPSAGSDHPTCEKSDRLKVNTDHLFGKPPKNRHTRIMVTLPGDAAENYGLIRELIVSGMNCARINCAHDSVEIWERLIHQIHRARRETGRECRILMDLGGPKLRTGAIEPGPEVLKWRPTRDAFGRVVTPARVWLHPASDMASCPAPADACVPVVGDWLKHVSISDRIELIDARSARRTLSITGQYGEGFWAEGNQTTYLVPGTVLELVRVTSSGKALKTDTPGSVGTFARQYQPIWLHRGDHLIITREAIPGLPAKMDAKGHLVRPASISCSLPEVFASVRPGERILIDDGRMGGIIKHVSLNEIEVEIIQAKDGGEKLLEDKGINLPDSELQLTGLTEEDLSHLPFIAKHADMVGLSFVRRPEDVAQLQEQLSLIKAEHLGIVLKIETNAAFECLPDLFFSLMRSRHIGVMIARGDLAVECGFERLAELQEEIMWLAEAAHIPLIWATQVLEGMAKNGKPSRAEISDVSMGERSECVMLNKGPHIVDAVRTLDDILQRMEGHQNKKSALLRKLHW